MRADRTIAVVSVVAGVLAAAGAQLGQPAGERTFATASTIAQSVISIGVPFIGALAGARHRRPVSRRATYLVPIGWAVLLAAIGLVASLLITALVDSAASDPWQHAQVIVVGAFVTQVVAQLTGIGLGLVIGRGWIAALATIVIPLGLYAVLPDSVRVFVAPYASAQLWWSGEFGASDWLPFLVMVALWGVALPLIAPSVAPTRVVERARGR